MSFADSFDVFFVIHADWCASERRPFFEKELARVGINKFTLWPPDRFDSSHPRLKEGLTPNGLSLIYAYLRIFEHAEKNRWKSIAILEDDIVFRKSFKKLWSEIEEQVREIPWGVLTLHRVPSDGKLLLLESVFSKTKLIPIVGNQRTHCVLVREEAYAGCRRALEECIEHGRPVDFFYDWYQVEYPGKLYATDKVLSGQRGGFPCTLTKTEFRNDTFYFRFTTARSWLEYYFYVVIRFVYRAIKRRKSGP